MARPLAAFQDADLYLDAMILVGYLDARSPWHPACRQLFARAIDPLHPIHLVTATLTIDELVFVLLQESLLAPPYSITRSRSQYLSGRPEVVQRLMATIGPAVLNLLELVTLEPVLPADMLAMCREAATSGMLPRNVIHVAVMRRLGITALASDDDGFDRCPELARFAP